MNLCRSHVTIYFSKSKYHKLKLFQFVHITSPVLFSMVYYNKTENYPDWYNLIFDHYQKFWWKFCIADVNFKFAETDINVMSRSSFESVHAILIKILSTPFNNPEYAEPFHPWFGTSVTCPRVHLMTGTFYWCTEKWMISS